MKHFIRSVIFALVTLMAVGGLSSLHAETPVAAPKATTEAHKVVNINSASVAELAEGIKGVGIKKAEAIVAYRDANGPFKSAEDLLKVKGIGQATLDKNRDRIVIQ